MSLPRLRDLNPLRLLHTNFSYQQLPTDSLNPSRNGSPFALRPLKELRLPSPMRAGDRIKGLRMPSLTRMLVCLLTSLLVLTMLVHAGRRHEAPPPPRGFIGDPEPYYWEHFTRYA